MTLRVVWDRLNVETYEGKDKDGRPQYSEQVLTRNAPLPDNVSEFNRQLYLSIGAAVDDGYAVSVVQNATNQQFDTAQVQPVLTPEQPPNPTAPSGGLGDFASPADTVQTADTSSEPVLTPDTLPDRPDDTARKDVWEDYAVQLGVERPRAESLTKANLIREADTQRSGLEKKA